MSNFREILRLYDLGYNQSEISRSCLVARSTVQDYIHRAQSKALTFEQVTHLNDSDLRQVLGKGQRQYPAQQESLDFQAVHRELKRKGVTLALLWQEGIDENRWTLSYSSFCRRYRQWKGRNKVAMRQVYHAGEKLFVDYSGLRVIIIDPETGQESPVEIFVACLGASNYTYAEATVSQSLENWLGSHQRALEFLGGAPRCIVPDNLKSGVSQACHYEPVINRSYQSFAEHYGIAILPARPKAPRDKAKVEKAVQEVERQILAPIRDQRFDSLAQLNGVIQERLQKLNNRVMKSYGASRQDLFEKIDKPELMALPKHGFTFAQWKQAKVNLDYHIEVNRHYYSVPYTFVRQSVMVKITETMVEIFHQNQRISCHKRSQAKFQHSTKAEHMPPEHWAYKSQSREKFTAWAKTIGNQTLKQVNAIFDKKTYDEQAFRPIRGLQHLQSTYGAERLEAACGKANALGIVGQRHLRSMLKTKLESEPLPDTQPHIIPSHHENVRGQVYFQ